MKIRIISDLHIDLNNGNDFKIDGDEFTIVAGDISGNPEITARWLRENLRGGGVFVEGNHLVYNNLGKPIQELREQLSREFPADRDITFLDVETGVYKKEVSGVLFLGTCLYTDFAYSPYGKDEDKALLQLRNMSISARTMNDYQWGIKSPGVRISPLDYLEWFNNGIKAFVSALEENNKRENPIPVVIVSHHAPLPCCVSNKYTYSEANASYTSDLEWLINLYPSIRCWIYGHIHDDQRTIVVNRNKFPPCLVVNNARGYCRSLEDANFNPDTFLDTETWTIKKTPLGKDARDELDRRTSEFLKISAPFVI